MALKRSMKGGRAAVVVVGVLAWALASTGARAQSITGLGGIAGDQNQQPQGVSANGSVVVGGSADGSRAFRWTRQSGIEEIAPGHPQVFAWGVSGNGAVVVGVCDLGDGTCQSGFRWTQAGGIQRLSVPPGWGVSAAYSASADGSVISGFSLGPNGYRAVRWTNAGVSGGTMEALGSIATSPPCGEASVYSTNNGGLSADGSIVVGESATSVDNCASHAFRWVSDGAGGGTLQDLGRFPLPSAMFSRAYAISGDGAVVVGWSEVDAGVVKAFRWSSGAGMEDIGPPVIYPSDYSVASATNADGSTAVGYFYNGDIGIQHSLLWTSTLGPVDLEMYLASLGLSLGDWTLTGAQGVSTDGLTIVGFGYHNDLFENEAWIVDMHRSCGSADFNCDGDIGTDADIESFFACLAGVCPSAPCTSSADFNRDEDIGTDADIESFFRVLSGGPC